VANADKIFGEKVISLRDLCTGRRPVHIFYRIGGIATAIVLALTPLSPAEAKKPKPAPVAAAQPQVVDQTVAGFYRSRNGAPLWLAPNAGDAAEQLIVALSSARADGLDPDTYHVSSLNDAIRKAWGRDRKAILAADEQLSEAFVAYVRDLRRGSDGGLTFVDPQLRPSPPSPLAILLEAAMAPSLSAYVKSTGWMHPIYGELRQALLSHNYASDHEREVLQLNLERARVLPAGPQRYVLVNAAQQRLYMYEKRQAVDSMVVVVGKPKWPTPMMAAYIRYAALNPYWYVPPDLAGEDVAQIVVKQGLKYLDDYGYEIVSDWSPNPTILDPKTIDWKGVVDGKVEVMIRQKPGPKNFMGRMKFMFPNQFGVYLHDNPRRELFQKAARYFSGGCVRLEDAARLGRWLFGRDLDWQSAGTEQPVPLAAPVPVYITYLTAMPEGSTIAYYDDVYGRDAAKLAGGPSSTESAGR
jgi:murein L,D-transpeptidase YcbB/YkuD